MEKECVNCGKTYTGKNKSRPKCYCSAKCRYAYFYANRDKLWCPQERVSECEYCGAEFDNWRNPKRKYCCRSHYFASRFGDSPVGAGNNERSECLSKMMRLKSEGVKLETIAEELNMPLNTVKGWIHRYSEKYLSQKEECAVEMISPELQSGIELCELPQAETRRIFLLCGVTRFTGKFDNFAAQVPQMLSHNLQIGDVFVFCNKSRYQLSVLQWQGDGFVLMFRRTEQERYPWSFSTQPKVVEITRQDLEMLLEYPRFMRRLRGLATPEFLL